MRKDYPHLFTGIAECEKSKERKIVEGFGAIGNAGAGDGIGIVYGGAAYISRGGVFEIIEGLRRDGVFDIIKDCIGASSRKGGSRVAASKN
ncbi:hypothetical protein PIB30_110253 [Stylosanthes scabra]|uniref:Uncharacterized protein n=1 Tax=Stylosanthes scabra TaxID=79078 RepID=A0ABU6T0Q7_9FABA|nr:hypothetical protein [Stylosanthes scabra]